MREPLSSNSVENLFIAVGQLQTQSGCPVNLRPEDVLQHWFLDEFSPLSYKCTENHNTPNRSKDTWKGRYGRYEADNGRKGGND